MGPPEASLRSPAVAQPEAPQRARLYAVAACLGVGLWGCAYPGAPEGYRPTLGQPGKDVIWLPTSDELLMKMLRAARVGPNDWVYDLGAGDGRIAIAAAKDFGARAVGIEYDARMAEHAQRNVERAGVASRVQIIQGDIFKEDFSKATVITLYLLEELNFRLRPTLLRMPAGTRVVSNTFSMGDWEPDEVLSAAGQTGYFWVVPATVHGNWNIRIVTHDTGISQTRQGHLKLTQRYQRVGGTLDLDGQPQPLLGVQLRGSFLEFRFIDHRGLLQAARVQVQAEQFQGPLDPPYGMLEIPISPGHIEGWRARY